MKYIIGFGVFALVIVGILGFSLGWWGNGADIGDGVAVRGVVTHVDMSQIAADGPFVIYIEDEQGIERVIHIPSMGLPLCAAREDIASVDSISVGAEIEVAGAADLEGVIVPCESESHYLRVLSEGEAVACTLDALLCPDGSGVGRSGPQCTFTACPNQPSWTGVLEQTPEGFFLVMETDALPESEYRMPLEVRASNAIAELVGETVVARGEFSGGNTLRVETLELQSAQ